MGTTRSLLYHKSSKEFITVLKQEIWWHKESFTLESGMTQVNLKSRKTEGHKELYPKQFHTLRDVIPEEPHTPKDLIIG